MRHAISRLLRLRSVCLSLPVVSATLGTNAPALTRDRWSDANGVGIRGTVRLGHALTIESREEVVGHAGSAGSLADNVSLDDSIKPRSPRKSLSDA